jgi:hypothetical protein
MPKKKKEDLPNEVSEQEVYNVIEFARQMYNMYPGVFNPDLVNARMKDITMNPLKATADQIDKALENPKNSEMQLRGISEFFEYTNMQYKRTHAYLGNMLSFDLTWVCKNAEKGDYLSSKFKKDENKLIDFLDKFNYRSEFKKAVRQMVRQDAYFCSFRNDNDDKYIFQELPIDRCKITGKHEYGSFLFDFDMIWFIANPGVDINMYPDIFKSYYNRVMDGKNNGYIPSKDLDHRTGEWVYWVQTSPEDGMWAFKFNQEQAGQVPMLAPMFPDLALAPYIRSLQTNKYIIEATRIMIGLVPLLENAKSGNVKDMLAIDPTTLGHFAQLIRQGLPSAISFGIAPLKDVKDYDFRSSSYTNIYEDYNKATTAMSGVNSRLIYSLDKQNALETLNSIGVDEYLMTYVYPQFASFMDFNVNKLTKYFKFKFEFEGTEFPTSRQNRFDRAMTLADKGIVLPHKIAAASGMNAIDLTRMLEEANDTNWTDKLMPLITAYTNSAKGGRPQKSEGSLSDDGANTRASGDNIGKGGEV